MEQGLPRERDPADEHKGQVVGTALAPRPTDPASANWRFTWFGWADIVGLILGPLVGAVAGYYCFRLPFVSGFEHPERIFGWGLPLVACYWFALWLGSHLGDLGYSRWFCTSVVAGGPFLVGIIFVLAANGDPSVVGAMLRRFFESVLLFWGLVIQVWLVVVGITLFFRHRDALLKIGGFLFPLSVLLPVVADWLGDQLEWLRSPLRQLASPFQVAGAAVTVLCGIFAFIASLVEKRRRRE